MNTMTFIKVPSKKAFRLNTEVRQMIRTSFLKYADKKTGKVLGHTLMIYLGKDLAQRINVRDGDRVNFHIEKDNPRIWFINKCFDSTGIKVSDVKMKTGKTTNSLRIQKSWPFFDPTDEDKQLRSVKFDFYQDGIRIFFLN